MPAKKTTSKPATVSNSETARGIIAQFAAARFKALGEPTRLKILDALVEGEKTIGALVKETGLGQANLSKHSAILKEAGAVVLRKSGLHTFVSAAPWVTPLRQVLLDTIKADHAAKAAALGE